MGDFRASWPFLTINPKYNKRQTLHLKICITIFIKTPIIKIVSDCCLCYTLRQIYFLQSVIRQKNEQFAMNYVNGFSDRLLNTTFILNKHRPVLEEVI